jgi:ribosomal protein L12E/L44/L45/RPP1/RPP2
MSDIMANLASLKAALNEVQAGLATVPLSPSSSSPKQQQASGLNQKSDERANNDNKKKTKEQAMNKKPEVTDAGGPVKSKADLKRERRELQVCIFLLKGNAH